MNSNKTTLSTILLVRNAAKTDFGGAETYQLMVADVLRSQGYNPIIVTRSDKLLASAAGSDLSTVRGWWWSRQNWSGVYILLTPFYVVWQFILTIWYVSLIIKTGADVLHLQSKDDFIAGTIAARLMGKRVVWTDHMDLRYIFQNVTVPFKNPVGKLVLAAARLTHHIILISQNEHRIITDLLPNDAWVHDKITIVNNGVIDKWDTYYPSSDATRDSTIIKLCLASRIVKNKGIGEAIEAFGMLSETHPALQLDIYGDGADRALFAEKAGANPRIIFHGHQDEALGKIAAADIFILPSYQEGFSIALLEALMLGKVIIASSVDSNPEIIHPLSNGLLVSPRSPDELAKAIQMLADDKILRERLSHNARQDYLNHYNLIDIVRNQLIPLYTR